MDANPYASPHSVQAEKETPVDALKWPAIATMICSLIAIAVAVIGFGVSIKLLNLASEYDRPELMESVRGGFVQSTSCLFFGLAGLFAAASMRCRRRRWLIVGWSMIATATCVLAPLGVVVLMRLWKPDLWTSFGR